MPLQHSSSPEAFKSNLKAELSAGKPRAQALAIAYSEQRRAKRADGGQAMIDAALHVMRRASGGVASSDAPYFVRQEARAIQENPYGFSVGIGGGRTDKNNVSLADRSYVLPADIVAGLGDGNSLAGAHVWNSILQSMPWAVSPPKSQATHRPPNPPHDASLMQGITGQRQTTFAQGGETPEVPIASADGEILIHPDDVLRVGQYYAPDHERKRGDYRAMMRRGHRVLDGFVKDIRGRTIKHLRGLKGPVGSKDAGKGHT